MFWADEFLEDVKGRQVINDSWTPSGIVHMGSLKGPVIHDTLYKILKEKKQEVIFQYGFDDADPIDGLPPELQESHSKYLGVPIFQAPSPDGKGSFGDYFGNKMRKLFNDLNIVPDEIYQTSILYKNGTFNKAISFILDHAAEIRKVYGDMYKKTIPETWFPLQVVCPNCSKLGTTKVTGWDGKNVKFSCEKNMVTWAVGCGKKESISPFDGNGKMPWKVEWAAKWWTFGVTIEGAGKDHGSAGGSYDIAYNIVRDVFRAKPPLKLVYEFFLTGGKKMSSSKGLGMTGEELLEVLSPEVARFLMIYRDPNQAVEFSPRETDAIPKLFEEFQQAYYQHSKDDTLDDLYRAFKLSKIGDIEKKPTVLSFKVISQWVQMPNMKALITENNAEPWAKYAQIWLEKYAPESEKFLIQKELPEQAKNLSAKQKEFLNKILSELGKKWVAEDFQKNIFEWAKEMGISSKDAFAAIYLSLIGKDHGPKAGWLILSMDKEFVKKRFEEVSSSVILNSVQNLRGMPKQVRHDMITSEIFSIDKKVKEKFSSVSVGVAIIKNVCIEKINQELEKEKEEILKSLENLTTEQLGQYPEIISYRKLYKEMKVDWHSKRPSPEALLRRIALKKGLYTVNTCVDAYNLVIMNHRVSVGAFDLDKLLMPSVLRFPNAGEKILLLGDETETEYKETELGYFDKNGGYNIDFNYRDAKRTAVQTSTKNLYINVDGIYDITPEKVEKVLKEACDTIIKYCGGKIDIFGVELGLIKI